MGVNQPKFCKHLKPDRQSPPVRGRSGCDRNSAAINKQAMAITIINKDNIIRGMKKGFPLTTAKGRPNEDGTYDKLVFVVQSINSYQMADIGHICINHEVDVNLKRSGTGISIQFS